MGVQKISFKVSKVSKRNSSELITKEIKDEVLNETKKCVNAGPHKKGSSGKTQAPIHTKSGKTKNSMAASHSTKNNNSELKTQSRSRTSNANKKSNSGSSGRGLLDSLGETVCREVACEGLATSVGYCRLHYIKNWKKIKRKELILREKKLNQYIEELVVKYPDKYIEAIRQDLANDKDFAKVIYDLDLDEGVDDFDVENAESADSLIDTIKRDFDDDGDGF